jgi:hypothetical protein
MLKNPKTEATEGHGGKGGIQGADEILVKPLCFFDLETYPCNGRQIFFWQVDDESYTEVIEP